MNDSHLAESYYSQYEADFVSESSNEERSESLSCDEASNNEDFDPIVTPKLTHTLESVLHCLKAAITLKSKDTDFMEKNEISVREFGPEMRQKKIDSMRRACIENLGAEQFAQAYVYVYSHRGKDLNEMEFQAGLRKFCRDPDTGFLLDQLIFLEHGSI